MNKSLPGNFTNAYDTHVMVCVTYLQDKSIQWIATVSMNGDLSSARIFHLTEYVSDLSERLSRTQQTALRASAMQTTEQH